MAFKDSIRLEQIYFKNLQTMVGTLKAWKGATTSEELNDVIDSCISANNAILLLYKNIGECWNDAVSLIVKNQEELTALKTELASYHTEINEKIDDVNNYLMNLIRELQEAVGVLQMQIQYRTRIVAWNEDEQTSVPLSLLNNTVSMTNYDQLFYGADANHLYFNNGNMVTTSGVIPDSVNCIRVSLEPFNDSPTQASQYYIKCEITVNVRLLQIDDSDFLNHEIDSGLQKTINAVFKHEYNSGTSEGTNSFISGSNFVDIQLPCSVGKVKELLNVDSPLDDNVIAIEVVGNLEFIDGDRQSWSDNGEDGFIIKAYAVTKPSMNPLD